MKKHELNLVLYGLKKNLHYNGNPCYDVIRIIMDMVAIKEDEVRERDKKYFKQDVLKFISCFQHKWDIDYDKYNSLKPSLIKEALYEYTDDTSLSGFDDDEKTYCDFDDYYEDVEEEPHENRLKWIDGEPHKLTIIPNEVLNSNGRKLGIMKFMPLYRQGPIKQGKISIFKRIIFKILDKIKS